MAGMYLYACTLGQPMCEFNDPTDATDVGVADGDVGKTGKGDKESKVDGRVAGSKRSLKGFDEVGRVD